MSRLSDAWAALCGRLPHQIAVDSAALVEVYQINDYSFYDIYATVSSRRHYATCAQAHASEPGRTVSLTYALKIDGKLYRAPDGLRLSEIELQPKPKRAKGARA